MGKKLLAVLVCAALVAAGIAALGSLMRPVDTDTAVKSIQTFHELPENSVEVLAYGSSHIWRGLAVNELYEKYGIGAYNYGCNWQKLNTTQLFFHDSLQTQSPKLVIIETYMVDKILQDVDIDGEIYYTRAVPASPYKRAYLRTCFAGNWGRYLSYYAPLFAFHENRVNLTWANFRRNASEADFKASKGFSGSVDVVETQVPDWRTFEQKPLPAASVAILDDLVQTCRARNIDVVFCTVPYGAPYNYADAMAAYAKANGCAYLDGFRAMKAIGLSGKTDFSDEWHLNSSGAKKFADYLGRYLAAHYKLTDMRLQDGTIWKDGF